MNRIKDDSRSLLNSKKCEPHDSDVTQTGSDLVRQGQWLRLPESGAPTAFRVSSLRKGRTTGFQIRKLHQCGPYVCTCHGTPFLDRILQRFLFLPAAALCSAVPAPEIQSTRGKAAAPSSDTLQWHQPPSAPNQRPSSQVHTVTHPKRTHTLQRHQRSS